MSRILFILNPTAGRERARSGWPAIEHSLRAAGVEFEIWETRAPREARSLAEQASGAGYSAVVGVGGDGTLHEVANGLLRAAGDGQTLPLGAIPLGTGNDFIKMIPPLTPVGGQPFTWQAAVEKVARMQTRLFDAGRLVIDSGVQYFFINSLDVGFGPATLRRLKSMPAALKGTAAYFAAALATLWEYPLIHPRVWMDGQEPVECQMVMFAAMNGRCFGNGFWAAPQAAADDGWLEILYGEKMSRLKMLSLMIRMLRGTHLGQPGVYASRARQVRIESTRPIGVEIDGELTDQPTRSLEIEILPRRLQVIV